mgnify:CR=1 FL=1
MNLFTQIKDTSKNGRQLISSLENAGIIPESLRIRTGTVTLAGVASGARASCVDDNGDSIQLKEGERVVLAYLAQTTAETNGATLQLGLAPTATGALGDVLSAVGAADLVSIQSTIPLKVGATNDYLAVAVTTANATGGVADVVIITV